MKGARFMVGAGILWGAAAGTGQQVLAQQNGGFPHGQTADSTLTLGRRVDELDQQVKILNRLRELAADSVTAAAKDRVTATAGAKDGFSLKSADGRDTLRFRGYFQSDGRLFPGTDATAGIDNLLIRRARPIIEATALGHWSWWRGMESSAWMRPPYRYTPQVPPVRKRPRGGAWA